MDLGFGDDAPWANLDGIADWSSSWQFVDAMKRSRGWISSPQEKWDDQRAFSLDAHGSPRA